MNKLHDIIKYTKNLKVLFVEDESIVRNSSIEMLGNFFDNIQEAKNGEEALALYKTHKFDLLITDIAMPKMDGIELLQAIRINNKTLPVLVFSALNDPSYISHCVALNVDGYILKPMKVNNLLNALEKITHKVSFQNSSLTQKPQELSQKLSIDTLTNLKSHSALVESMHNLLPNYIPVMILINIDEFRIYNELYGLDKGDEILIQFSKNLEKFASSLSYELYRMHGDEFVLFEKVKALDIQKYEEDVKSLFEHIETSSIKIDSIKEKITLNVSVGISFDADNNYGRADMALHEARRRGRKYLGFSADADRREALEKNLYWREEINNALQLNKVYAYYLPIVDADENILKYESLIRIKQVDDNGKTNLIVPSKFLDFSKISKQYIALTKVMINESFDTMIKHNVHVAINLTFHDIQNKEINILLHDRITKHHLANKTKFDISSQVIFELLDHSTHEDYHKLIDFIDEFKSLGVLITIDNFGLGFDNMSKLSAISPNYVKIDASLMKNIDVDKHAYTLVKAIVKFAQELGIKTIAEHVNTKAIFQASKELGIDEFQGYYFGKPLEKIF